jgi:hypothetical protein
VTRSFTNISYDSTAHRGQGPLHYRDSTNTHTHARWESTGRVISPTQRPLIDNTQHSQDRDIRATGGIRTRNTNQRATADPRLKPHGPWWPLVLKIASSLPAEDFGFFFRRKNSQHAFLRKGSKAVCPMSQICGMLKNPVIYRGSRKL